MTFTSKEIEDYCERNSDSENELLAGLNRNTHAKVLNPRMLSGHLQGRLLATFSKMIKPNRILEIGTYTGYSAICLAEGLSKDGHLITIDKNEELETMARAYFQKSEYASQIEYIIGNAMKVIDTVGDNFDIIFIDADKSNYLNYYEKTLPLLKVGGYIIADNVLWSGKVVSDLMKIDKDTQAILDFNRTVTSDQRVSNLLLPIRDGLMIVQKL
tara:strand:- start:1084 stop:1725 length:642 start_codon:yes stop_codon:yes gene_type:complete